MKSFKGTDISFYYSLQNLHLKKIRNGLTLVFQFKINFSNYEYFHTFDMTPWTKDLPMARPLPAQDSYNTENANLQPFDELDSNPPSLC